MAGSGGEDVPPPEGDVVIVVGDGSGDPGRGTPPRRGWPSAGRRIGAVLGIAAVFVFGIVVGRTSVGRSGTATAPVSTPSAVPTAPTAPAVSTSARTGSPSAQTGSPASQAPASSPLLDSSFATAVAIGVPGQADVEAVAVVGDRLVILTSGWLSEVNVDSHGGLSAGDSAAVGLPLGDPSYAAWQLISGPDAVWAFAPAKRLYSVDTASLETGPLILVPAGAMTAVALGEHLYLNTDVGVFDVTSSTQQGVSPPVVARGGRAIAADPTRHRLLITEDDDGWAVYAYTPPDSTPAASGSLPFRVTSIAVASGEIWATGMTTDTDPRPVLARLNPTTLRVAARSVLERSLTSAPVVVASGRSLWIRDSDGGGDLWCVDATTGTVAQHWSALPGLVAVGGGRAFVARGNVIGELRLNSSCAA